MPQNGLAYIFYLWFLVMTPKKNELIPTKVKKKSFIKKSQIDIFIILTEESACW